MGCAAGNPRLAVRGFSLGAQNVAVSPHSLCSPLQSPWLLSVVSEISLAWVII